MAERKVLCDNTRRRLESLAKTFGLDVQVITPFDIAERLEAKGSEVLYGEYLGADIQVIVDEVDVIYFLEDPQVSESRGVRAEYQIGLIYEKAMIW